MRSIRHRLVFAFVLAGLVSGCRFDHEDDAGDDPGDQAAIDATVAEVDAAPVADADPAAPDADPAAPDAAAGGESTIISCGADTCSRDSEICCYTNFPNITQMCAAADACMAPAVIATCDGPEDCTGGDICCVNTTGAVCKPASECTGTTAGQVCHTDEDCPGPSPDCHTIQFVPWPIC
jgi:hypothetical protein